MVRFKAHLQLLQQRGHHACCIQGGAGEVPDGRGGALLGDGGGGPRGLQACSQWRLISHALHNETGSLSDKARVQHTLSSSNICVDCC